ncbi:hypothetical protein HAPAU_27400 [Halalkalicoccus paucihalophilus]|jgi:mannose/fructose/N-acetylgalactosamine-specific phosphotransferase system component IIC|uniref:Uncharacterized protein n=1 Tax=Halalkalicoccus paucihalophilus TaxID=1008153 RepID=A0A151ABT6_9EURY|nr:hypothetical protein [Halalkalicoccus paucihalophilus]KYH25156.1 hypothetical protein HAPAU_27400 [Halalkalicoccus paucihalophilus]
MVLDALLTVATSFLVIGLGFCLTLHIAARYVLGDVPIKNALAGLVPAVIVLGLTLVGQPIPAAGLAIVAELIVIRSVYDVPYRLSGLITLVHFTVSFLLGFALQNLLALLETAPT